MPAITPRQTRLVAVTLPAFAALLAACGSSSNESSSITGQQTSSTFSSISSVAPPSGAGAPSSSPTPCTTASFGAALAPKDQPSNVHVYSQAPTMQINAAKLYLATIMTSRGDIVLCLQPKLAPNTVNNFVVLARNHFFDGLTFHRVVPNFVIQGGDPKGDGTGGPGYQFADEPVQGGYTPGCVAMANSGPNTNGSQFFVCIADDSQLPKSYNLFGQVSKGFDVAVHIAQGDVMTKVTVQEQS